MTSSGFDLSSRTLELLLVDLPDPTRVLPNTRVLLQDTTGLGAGKILVRGFTVVAGVLVPAWYEEVLTIPGGGGGTQLLVEDFFSEGIISYADPTPTPVLTPVGRLNSSNVINYVALRPGNILQTFARLIGVTGEPVTPDQPVTVRWTINGTGVPGTEVVIPAGALDPLELSATFPSLGVGSFPFVARDLLAMEMNVGQGFTASEANLSAGGVITT